jgi:opacity protein-like surface antigen
MNKNILCLVVSLLLCSTFLSAQSFRTSSMGGMSLVIKDADNTFNLYDFGRNPAWLVKDETADVLKIIPGSKFSSGQYKRKYDPSEVSAYGIVFDGIKTLGELGTFRGYTSYDVEYYDDIYGSLRRFTYGGDAFFLADTNRGSFRYNGPTVNFMYSIEILPDLYAGASLSYQLIEGLKDVYSRAQSLIRRIGGNIGLAYQPSDNFSVGLSYEPNELQERIESKSEDLLDVELFLFRGETYSFKRRGSSVDYKTKTFIQNFSTQLNYKVSDNIELAGKGTYSLGNTKIIIPSGAIKEYEEGYAFFDGIDVQILSRYEPVTNIVVGLSAGYQKGSSWSKHSGRELLLWEWDVNGFSIGSGVSYYFIPDVLLAGFELHYQNMQSDSSKYIDNRFQNIESNNHLIKTGLEYVASGIITIRAGFSYGTKEYDLIFGGKNVTYTAVTGGAGLNLFKDAVIDILIEYALQKPDEPVNLKKSFFSGFISLKLLTF